MFLLRTQFAIFLYFQTLLFESVLFGLLFINYYHFYDFIIQFYSGSSIASSGLFFLEFVSLFFMCVNAFITGLSFSFLIFYRSKRVIRLMKLQSFSLKMLAWEGEVGLGGGDSCWRKAFRLFMFVYYQCCVISLVVRIAAFQAVDPGSNPG